MENENEFLNELSVMQKRFDELYHECGLTSLTSHSGVHLTEKSFLSKFAEYSCQARDCAMFQEELYAYHNGVRFFCLRKEIM